MILCAVVFKDILFCHFEMFGPHISGSLLYICNRATQSQLGVSAHNLLPPKYLQRPSRQLILPHPPPRALRSLSSCIGLASVEMIETSPPDEAPFRITIVTMSIAAARVTLG
jgi:hypothetical protein